MAKRTQQERLVEALTRRGETIVTARHSAENTERTVKMTRKNGGFWFIGKAGALRFGRNASTSIAALDQVKTRLLHEVPE